MKDSLESSPSRGPKSQPTQKREGKNASNTLLDTLLSNTGLTPVQQQNLRHDLEKKLKNQFNCTSANVGLNELRQVMLLYLEQVDALQQPDKRLYN